jgi:hypothetical protein
MRLPAGWSGPPSWHAIVVVALVLLHALPAPWSLLIVDNARDFIEAGRLLRGDWPLRGPLIGGLFHLGPLWYLVVALPWALSGSIAATLTVQALLASLKFPLAYLCGRRLGDPRLGLCWAIALAVPGMASFTQLVVSHTSVVEAAALAWLYTLLRLWQRGDARWWIGCGAAATVALHAHPTTMVIAPLVLAVALRRRAWHGSELRWIAAGLVLALVPLLPLLAAESATDWRGLARLSEYAASGIGQGGFAGLAALYLGLLGNGPRFIADALVSADLGIATWLAYALIGAATLAGAAVALRADERPQRGLLFVVAGLLLAIPAAIAVLREVTPYYMLLVWKPFAALFAALCWCALARAVGARPIAALLAVVVALHALVALSLIRRGEQGLVELPAAAIADLRASARRTEAAALLPAWRLERFAATLCREAPVVLHAGLAQLVAVAVELPLRVACPDAPAPSYGGGAGTPASRHFLGLSPRELRRLGHHDADWPLALRLAPVQVIAAANGRALAFDDTYPYLGAPARRRQWQYEFVATADARVVVATPLGLVDGSRIMAVEAGGVPAQVLSMARSVAVYRCSGCRGEVRWRVEAEAAAADFVDITIAPAPCEAGEPARSAAGCHGAPADATAEPVSR